MVVYWLDICMVVCLNLGRHELSFPFAKIPFGMKVKGQTNPSRQRVARKAEKTFMEQPLNVN